MNNSDSDIEANLREILEEDKDVPYTCNLKENQKCWTRVRTKLLISTRLELEDLFKKGKRNKTVLWNNCLRKIKSIDEDFPFTVEDIMRKFHNLMTTFKRSKRKAGRTGESRVSWEFYEDFNMVYGSKHSIKPPQNMTIASLEVCGSKEIPETGNTSAQTCDSDGGNQSETRCETPNKKRKSTANKEILDLLRIQYEKEDMRIKEQEEKEEVRFQELLKIEREKTETEKEKVKAILEFKDMLSQLLK